MKTLLLACTFAVLGAFESVLATELKPLADMQTLSTALEQFRQAHGRYPTRNEGLQILVTNPQTDRLPNWQQLLWELPIDPWGHSYQYVPPAPTEMPELYSFGHDGISRSNGNDPDDWNTWRRQYPGHDDSERSEFASTETYSTVVWFSAFASAATAVLIFLRSLRSRVHTSPSGNSPMSREA